MGSTACQWCSTHDSVVVDDVHSGGDLEWMNERYGTDRDNEHRLLCERSIRLETARDSECCVVVVASITWEG